MIKEISRRRYVREVVSFEIPEGLVPDRPAQYSHAGRLYRPHSISAYYTRTEAGVWEVDRVLVFGMNVLKTGKTSIAKHTERIYRMPSEKSWLTDLVRENTPHD
jgi:hypothetical protein